MENTFFMHRIKHDTTKVTPWDKGIEVHETRDSALQSYHAYLGAYAYGHDANVDYVKCMVDDTMSGVPIEKEEWIKPEPEPELEPEPEPEET
jgi:hypothetical protein